VATKVTLHRLPGSKRALEVARLAEQLLGSGRRLVLWVEDEGRRTILDGYLWTYEKLSFLPHVLWGPSMGPVEDPVVLVGEPANPNRAEVLLVGDEIPPPEWAARFAEVHDLAPPGPAGGGRRTAWEEAGFEVEDV